MMTAKMLILTIALFLTGCVVPDSHYYNDHYNRSYNGNSYRSYGHSDSDHAHGKGQGYYQNKHSKHRGRHHDD